MELDEGGRNFKSRGADAASFALRLLFPPQCAGCRKTVGEPGALCASCWSGMRFLSEPWCDVLGIPFETPVAPGTVSAAALARPPRFGRARAAVAYDGVARTLVQSLKFRDRTEMAPWMARWMMRCGRELLADADMITAVPLHRRRLLWRRFNQSAELARALSRLSSHQFDPDILRRVKPTRQQMGLGLKERQTNVRGAFAVPAKLAGRVAGRHVLLVDDVFTTGATVDAAAHALKRAGAKGVDVLTFARVLPQGFLHGDGTII